MAPPLTTCYYTREIKIRLKRKKNLTFNGGKMQRLWITGYRAYELEVFDDNDPKVKVIKWLLKKELENRLNNTTDEFWLISGPQMGIERWAIEVGYQLKKEYSQLKLSIIQPYQNVGARWNEINQAKLAQALQMVDFQAAVSNKPYQSPLQLKNYQSFMLNHSDGILLIYDSDQENNPERKSKPYWDYQVAKKYAEDHDYNVRIIDFEQLQEAAEEYAEAERDNQEFNN